jgi:uncharacterized protein YbcC (UPF0753/DUF2309 family)
VPSARVASGGLFVLTELLVVAVQSTQGASPKEVIIGAAAVVTAFGVLWGVAKWFLKPLLHNWWHAVLKNEPERTAVDLIRVLDSTDDTRAVFRRYTDRVYHDKIASDTETRHIAEQNSDELTFLKESNARQGEAITKELARAMEHMARATDQQTRIMEKIQKELEDHSIIIARLDERISMWDGEERRKRPR